ncbi:MAG: hypothetical protein V3U79_09820 [Dehalococcoidia bacterium]
MNAALQTQGIASAGFRRAVIFGLIGALLMGIMVVNAVTSTDLGSQSIRLGRETFSDDTDVSVASQRIFKLKNADVAGPAGDTTPGVEAASGLPQVNNNLTRNDYAYEFVVQEAALDSFQSGENFKIEVYMDDGTTNSLLATLYTKQVDLVDDGTFEGVTVVVNSGLSSVVGDTFSIVITRQ